MKIFEGDIEDGYTLKMIINTMLNRVATLQASFNNLVPEGKYTSGKVIINNLMDIANESYNEEGSN